LSKEHFNEQAAVDGEQTVYRQGPNANYKLSNSDNKPAQEGLTFYYNRERRLENAPDNIKGLYKEQRQTRFSLFGPLVADKPRRILFLIIIFMCVLIFALSALGFFDRYYSLDGNRIDVSGTSFEGMTIVTITKTVRNQGAYTGLVDIAVSPFLSGQPEDGQFPVFYHRIFFTLENEEQYRFAVPFDTPELLMVLQTEKDILQLKFKSE
jgi:hypothetical protein